MPSSSTSPEPKPSSDSASDDDIVAYTTDGRPIVVAHAWRVPPGTWAERARVG